MKGDHGVVGAMHGAWGEVMGTRLPLYHYVPYGVLPPYGVLTLTHMGVGNGLPSPHFKTRGTFTIKIWSAYEGMAEISDLVGQASAFWEGRKIELGTGFLWCEVKGTTFEGQQAGAKKLWREGCVEGVFILCL